MELRRLSTKLETGRRLAKAKNLAAAVRAIPMVSTEIETIASTILLDHWNIDEYEPDARTAVLEVMKDKLVRPR